MSTVYRLPERSESDSTRDGMKGRVVQSSWQRNTIVACHSTFRCTASPILFLLKRSMPWRSCWKRVTGEEAIPRIVTEPGCSAREHQKPLLHVVLLCNAARQGCTMLGSRATGIYMLPGVDLSPVATILPTNHRVLFSTSRILSHIPVPL